MAAAACRTCDSVAVDIHGPGGTERRPACGCPEPGSCAAPGVPRGRQAGGNRWFCPVCAGPLSYGIFCKQCRVEASFAWRPPVSAAARVLAELRALLAPSPGGER